MVCWLTKWACGCRMSMMLMKSARGNGWLGWGRFVGGCAITVISIWCQVGHGRWHAWQVVFGMEGKGLKDPSKSKWIAEGHKLGYRYLGLFPSPITWGGWLGRRKMYKYYQKASIHSASTVDPFCRCKEVRKQKGENKLSKESVRELVCTP